MSDEVQQPYFCANHPQRETRLRCNRCEKPICNDCVVSTPTGYRCRECVRGQQKSFETARSLDPVLGGVIALVLSVIGSYISSLLGFFTILVAPIFGVLIAEAVRWAVRKRRSPFLYKVAAGAAAVGGIPLLALHLLSFILNISSGEMMSIYFILPLIWPGLYIFLVTSSVYYRLSGLDLR